MPETPLSSRASDDGHPSSFSNTARLDDSDGGDIIPYSETLKIGEMETDIKQQQRPVAEISAKDDTRHLSSHEVLVHAQIGSSKQRPLQQEEMINEPQIEYQSESQPQIESEIEPQFESQTESRFESAEHLLAESGSFSDLDLSLPELPSSDEAGLKLPEYSDELFTDEEQLQPQVEIESRQQLSRDSSTNRSANAPASPDITAKDVAKDYAQSLGNMERNALERPGESIALDGFSIKSGSINSGSFKRQEKPSEVMTSDSQSVKSNFSSRHSESNRSITKSKQISDSASAVSDAATATPDSVISARDTTNDIPDSGNVGVALRDSKFEYFEISLTKGSTGLGFTLAGGKSTTGQLRYNRSLF